MDRLLLVAFAVLLCGCSATTAPTGADGGKLYGRASCAASAIGSCPTVSGQTYFSSTAGEAFYFAPDGWAYTWQRSRITRARWFADPNSAVIRFEGGGATLSSAVGIPIAQLRVFSRTGGDTAGMVDAFAKTGGNVPEALQPFEDFGAAAARLRAV